MPVAPIPLLRVAGSHREVGRAVGTATAPALREAVRFDAALPAGRSRGEQLALAARYRAATLAATPWLVEEIDGAAAGAGVDPSALFAASIEEIWSVRPSQAAGPAPGPGPGLRPRSTTGRCSDLIIGPPHTADGHLWVAHNNDLGEASEARLVAIEWRVPGEPAVFSLGIGPWISVGWNDAGLSLTGNELSPNDERIGVPRLLMVREQLTARTLDAAVSLALRPDRASSYNTVLAHRDGRVANVEGSGADAIVRTVATGEWLAHTNHYVEPAMLRYEGDPGYAGRSAVRYRRACALLAAAAAAPAGRVTPAVLRAWLSDHDGAPDSICRHPDAPAAESDAASDPGTEGRTKTVFWVIADVTTGRVAYGRGNPCAGAEPQRHAFA
jgi:isopenicillin-N N-acyltransferase like protein